MDTALRVLIVEDSESDAGLIVRDLVRNGYITVHERVENAEAMREALKRQAWDIVIADYNMPQFDAFAALKILQECGRDIPCIVVSDTMGEDNAVEMMKAGAHDYVMKDNRARLIPSVQRELKYAEDRRKHRQAEVALRQSEERYRALYEDNPSMYFSVDAEGKVLSVNRCGAEMLGYSVEELVGSPVLIVFHRDDREAVEQQFIKCLQNPLHVTRWEFRKVRKDGSIMWVREAARAVQEPDGNTVVLVVCEDITEHKKAAQALRESETKYRIVADNTYAWEFWLGTEGQFMYSSPSCKRITGHTAEEFVADPQLLYRIIHPDDRQSFIEHRKIITIDPLKTPDKELQFRIIRPDGTECWIGHVCQHVFDDEGKYLGNRGSNRDITNHKRADDALRASERRLADIIDFLPDATFAINQDGVVIAWNRAIEEMTEIKAHDIVGKGNYEYALPFYGIRRPLLIDLAIRFDEDIKNKYVFVKQEGDILLAEAEFQLKGKSCVLWGKAAPLYDVQGYVIGAIESIRDITERKRTEEALKNREIDLEGKTRNLEDLNTALKVLLRQREKDKEEFEKWVLENIQNFILPYIEKLKNISLEKKAKTL